MSLTESNLEKRYRRWAEEKGIKLSEGKINFEEMDSNILAFKREVQEAYYLELTEHMRSIGVKIPITGTNWAINPNLLSTQLITDFVDSHAYWWFGDQRKFESRIMTGSKTTIVDKLTFSRVLDKPYFVSEWMNPGQISGGQNALYTLQLWGCCRIGLVLQSIPIVMAAIWMNLLPEKIGRDLVIGNSYYRGIFDTYNDPAKYGLFYHAALMMRRGDVKTRQYQCRHEDRGYRQS
ncbi:MAG: hypothetical protein ACOX22_05350 [Caldicoprobacterales bacterium]